MSDVEQNAATTKKPGGVTGKGFKPGQSGNPGGRPKGLGALVREQTRDGAELVEFMLEVFRGKRKAKLQTRIDAATWLADRGFGKPVQTTELTGAGGGPISIGVDDSDKMTAEERDAVRRIVTGAGPR